LECGACCPRIFGDPALLLPRLYRPKRRDQCAAGLIAHFADKPYLAASLKLVKNLKLIDIQDPIESVIDQIVSCEFVASSSLHGIITSHAYGIPAVRVEFRPLPGGDGSKFADYFASIGHETRTPVRVDYERIDLARLARFAQVPSIGVDLEALWYACPFRT
jgi:hypothetical protein